MSTPPSRPTPPAPPPLRESGDDGAEHGGFVARWSRRKREAGLVAPEAAAASSPASPPPPVAAPAAAAAAADAPAALPAPTLQEAQALAPSAPDFTRFVAPGVDDDVKRTALKALFRDPHFNVMDGLDVYIDDYGLPDPLPAGMLHRLAHGAALGLLRSDAAAPAGADHAGAREAAPQHCPSPADEDPDLRLQPHDAAERAADAHGARRAGPHAGGEPERA